MAWYTKIQTYGSIEICVLLVPVYQQSISWHFYTHKNPASKGACLASGNVWMWKQDSKKTGWSKDQRLRDEVPEASSKGLVDGEEDKRMGA